MRWRGAFRRRQVYRALMLTSAEREARAQLKLAAEAYRKAQVRYAASPTPKRAAKVAIRRAELNALLESATSHQPLAA